MPIRMTHEEELSGDDVLIGDAVKKVDAILDDLDLEESLSVVMTTVVRSLLAIEDREHLTEYGQDLIGLISGVCSQLCGEFEIRGDINER